MRRVECFESCLDFGAGTGRNRCPGNLVFKFFELADRGLRRLTKHERGHRQCLFALTVRGRLHAPGANCIEAFIGFRLRPKYAERNREIPFTGFLQDIAASDVKPLEIGERTIC